MTARHVRVVNTLGLHARAAARFVGVAGRFKSQIRVTRGQRTMDGKETGVGFGWRIGHDESGRLYLHHGGDTVGGRAFVLVYPEHRVAVALLTNLTFARIGEAEARRVAEPYLTSLQ